MTQGPRATLADQLRSDIASHDAQLFTTPHLSRIRHAEEALLRLIELKDGDPGPAPEAKRTWLTWTDRFDKGYRTVETKYGPVQVAVWSENRVNVEVRDPVTVNQHLYSGTVTLKCVTWGRFVPDTKWCAWRGGPLSRSAEEKLLRALGEALSAETWIEAEFLLADRREVNNDIMRADDDLRKAEAALSEVRARREELLRREAALGGRIDAEAGEPAA